MDVETVRDVGLGLSYEGLAHSEVGPSGLAHSGPAAGTAVMPNVEGFQIFGPLGQGGMGSVWRALQLSTRREVALKMLSMAHFGSERARRRFEREVELAGKLEHPLIARVYHSGVHQGVYFYAMELVEGSPLDRHVREAKLGRDQIVELVARVADAVQHAHQRGIIHRDLKPSNILVDDAGKPRVLDFGLAKTFEVNDAGSAISLEGEVAGTPAFMSPEQAAGKTDQLDTRTDVYSLGVILYWLLTGKSPHDLSGTQLAVLDRIAHQDITHPRSSAPDLDGDLVAILFKALCKDPEGRYLSAGDLAADLRRYLAGELVTAKSPTAFYWMRKKLRKHRAGLSVAGAVAALVLGTIIGSMVYVTRAWAREKEERRAAELGLADMKVYHGGSRARDGRPREALHEYEDAKRIYVKNGVSPLAAELGMSELLRSSAPSLVEFPGRGRGVSAVAFAGAGDVLWADGSGTVRGRDVADPASERVISAGDGGGGDRRVAIAAGGGFAVVSGEKPDQTMVLERIALAGGVAARSGVLPPANTEIAVSADGEVAAFGIADKAIGIYRFGTGKLVEIDTGGAGVSRVALASDGRWVYAILGGGSLRRWDGQSGAEASLPEVGSVAEVLPSPAGGKVLLVGQDLVLSVLDLEKGKLRRLGRQGSQVRALAWAGDGERVLSGGADGTVCLWDANGSGHKSFDCAGQPVRSLAVSSDGRLAAAACGDGVVRILPIGEGADEDVLTAQMAGPLRAGVMSDDGSVLLAGDAAGRLRLFDAGSGREVRAFGKVSHSAQIGAVALAEGGKRALSADLDGTVKTWEVASGKLLDEVRMEAVRRAQGMSIGRDGVVLAWGLPSMSGGVYLSRDGGRSGVALLSVDTQVAEISPDRKWVVAADRKGGLMMIGVADGVQPIWGRPVSEHGVTALAFNASSDRVICGDAEGTVRLVETATGRVFWAVKAHADGRRVAKVAFCPDARTALSAGDDGMMRMVDLEGGQEIFVMPGEQQMQVLSFTGGKLLSGGSASRSVRVTELARAARYQELRKRVEDARGAAGGGMSPEYAKALADWFTARGEGERAAKLVAAQR